MEKWIEDAKAIREEDVLLILVGNKSDMDSARQVSTEEGQRLAEKLNLLFFETSAKSGANIKTLFNELAKKLTGIETDPIPNAEEKKPTGGFTLGADGPTGGPQNKDVSAALDKMSGRNKKCKC